jgi:hypothetical protein
MPTFWAEKLLAVRTFVVSGIDWATTLGTGRFGIQFSGVTRLRQPTARAVSFGS